MRYWLMKSEPEEFSLQDLKKNKTTRWTGVRNYQARNFMTQDMQVGDLVLFYHSNTQPPGVVGLATVSAPAAPDATALDKRSEYYDAKATKEKPIWECVEVKYTESFKSMVTLEDLRNDPALADMAVLRRGQRLSIQPVSEAEFHQVCKKGGLSL